MAAPQVAELLRPTAVRQVAELLRLTVAQQLVARRLMAAPQVARLMAAQQVVALLVEVLRLQLQISLKCLKQA